MFDGPLRYVVVLLVAVIVIRMLLQWSIARKIEAEKEAESDPLAITEADRVESEVDANERP